jgi:NDP-sugar pyrophosphorylase family protein
MIDSGVETITLLVSDQHDQITNHFGNGSGYNASIEYLTEDEPLGTAGGLRQLRDRLSETFLLVNGDVLCRADLQDMARTHRESEALATMALTTVQDTSPYGVVRLKGNSIIGFTEKPETGAAPSRLINAGMYLLEPEVIDLLPTEDEQQQVDVEDLFEPEFDPDHLHE